MQSFNHFSVLENLQERDFKIYFSAFREVIEKKLPQFDNLFFLNEHSHDSEHIGSSIALEKTKNFFSTHTGKDYFYCSIDNCIISSIPESEHSTLLVLTGIDSYFANKVSIDWLENFSREVSDQFLHIKKAGIDLATGLYNDTLFYETLMRMERDTRHSVMFVEVFPQVRTSKDAILYTAKTIRSLESCIDGKLPLFYLGHHVFGLISTSAADKVFVQLGEKILRVLRRDGFRRVHIGVSSSDFADSISEENRGPALTAENANYALQIASKRGPFSLCDYERLRHPEMHPLRKPSKSLLSRFRRKWSKAESFSILQFEPSHKKDFEKIQEVFDQDTVICCDDDLYLYLPETSPQDALRIGVKKLSNAHVEDVIVGVAYYPYKSFSKSSTVFSCRRALKHASFLGSNGNAILDGVSFNVSGDIYYAEGDIASAVKEYKAGLSCEENNINLLNSLGVAYADMENHKMAQQCFDNALALDEVNFMALYNSGLGAALKGRNIEALQFFEKAYRAKAEFPEAMADVKFNLGKLYCQTGNYRDSVEILKECHVDSSLNRFRDRSLAYLGKSYYGLGEAGEAMTWLQRALKYNEFDAKSMGLLGLIYLINKEGNDIALSLCEKSVELEADDIELKLFLARAQLACRKSVEARSTLKKCLRNQHTKIEAQLLMCRCYMYESAPKKARYWLNKTIEENHLTENASAQLTRIKEELNGF